MRGTASDLRPTANRSSTALAIAKKIKHVVHPAPPQTSLVAQPPSSNSSFGLNNCRMGGFNDNAQKNPQPNRSRGASAQGKSNSSAPRPSPKIARLAKSGSDRNRLLHPQFPLKASRLNSGPQAPSHQGGSAPPSRQQQAAAATKPPQALSSALGRRSAPTVATSSTLTNRKRVQEIPPRARVLTTLERKNQLLNTRPGATPFAAKPTASPKTAKSHQSNLSKVFGRNASRIRTSFQPPGQKPGGGLLSTTGAVRRNSKVQQARPTGLAKSRGGGAITRGGGVAVRRASMMIRRGGGVGPRGRLIGPGGAQRRFAPPRQIQKELRLEDIYGDESDDWIVEDDNNGEAWRNELLGTAFDYEKYKNVNVDDAEVSSVMQMKREELYASRIAAKEDEEEKLRLEQLEESEAGDSEEDEDDAIQEAGDFIVEG
eukprot:GHVH01008752.1.p1 GENE.GHVH01008752.1~~GHVH01008752.1.p1  ORF type:complete len:429 (+),score=50.53 GHVH01008752.1:232-1518(+)